MMEYWSNGKMISRRTRNGSKNPLIQHSMPPVFLHCFNNNRRALTAADASAGQTELLISPTQFM